MHVHVALIAGFHVSEDMDKAFLSVLTRNC